MGGSSFEGTIYLHGGRFPLAAELFEVRGRMANATQLSDIEGDQGVSTFSARDGRVVIASGRRRAVDEVEELDLEADTPLPGRIVSRGSVPALGPAGQLAFIRERERAGRLISEMVVERRPHGQRRVELRHRELFQPIWLKGGRLAVTGGRPGKTRLFVLGSRRVKTVRLPDPYPSRLLVSIDGRILQARAGRTWLFSRHGRVSSRWRSKWVPLAWAPSGRELLVLDNSSSRLGVMNPASRAVRELGRFSGGRILTAEWVP